MLTTFSSLCSGLTLARGSVSFARTLGYATASAATKGSKASSNASAPPAQASKSTSGGSSFFSALDAAATRNPAKEAIYAAEEGKLSLSFGDLKVC